MRNLGRLSLRPPPALPAARPARSAPRAPPPPGRGFPGRAGPFHPGSENDVGVNENKRGARGEGRRIAGELRSRGRGSGSARGRPVCSPTSPPGDARARARRPASCTRPLRAVTSACGLRRAGSSVRGAGFGAAGRGCPGRGPAGRDGATRSGRAPTHPITAAGARPGGCAVPGSEAWRGFCTSGPTISQVLGLGGFWTWGRGTWPPSDSLELIPEPVWPLQGTVSCKCSRSAVLHAQ